MDLRPEVADSLQEAGEDGSGLTLQFGQLTLGVLPHFSSDCLSLLQKNFPFVQQVMGNLINTRAHINKLLKICAELHDVGVQIRNFKTGAYYLFI